MREILFRGKRIDNGEWVEGFYHYTNWYHPVTKELAFTNHWILPVGGQDAFQVDPETVGQYTGLIDKNGKKIFEGDIVRTTLPLSKDKYKKGVVLFGEYDTAYQSGIIGFYVVWDFAPNLAIYCRLNDIEVIGNIHDNPELLKGGE